jgi:hypothetical protein
MIKLIVDDKKFFLLQLIPMLLILPVAVLGVIFPSILWGELISEQPPERTLLILYGSGGGGLLVIFLSLYFKKEK